MKRLRLSGRGESNLLPLDAEYDIVEARHGLPEIGLPQLVLKVHSTKDPARDYYVHAVSLRLLP